MNMKRNCLMILATFLVWVATMAEVEASSYAVGVVFHDANGNGVRERREMGIADVAVSNGRDVVLTDDKGAYQIPVGEDQIVFVIKPGNYDYPVNELNLPQFFYNHKPSGSPELKYSGVAPTGELPKSLDFPLLTGSDSETFSVVVMSDPQPYFSEEIGYYEAAIVEELKGIEDFAFGLTLGDLVGDRPDFFEALNTATARIGLPWHHVLGNHDLNFDAKAPEHADESFERVYGSATYAFNHGKVHFLVLKDVLYPNTYSDALYMGGFTEDQFEFIENSLKYVPKDHLVVLSMHIPLYNDNPEREAFLNAHRERLFKLLADRPHTLSMSGHTHTQRHYYFGADEGWLASDDHHHYTVGTAGGDWWSGTPDERGIPDALMRDGTPKGYNLLHFNGNQYVYDYKVAGAPAEYKMRLWGPKVVPHNSRYRGELYVNFFQGCEKTKVEFRINDSEEWRSMSYLKEHDPQVADLRSQWDNSMVVLDGVRPSNPEETYHLWKTRVTTRLPLGKNVYEVRVTDAFGREFLDQFEFEVVEVKQ